MDKVWLVWEEICFINSYEDYDEYISDIVDVCETEELAQKRADEIYANRSPKHRTTRTWIEGREVRDGDRTSNN